jgi:hypothetical protein
VPTSSLDNHPHFILNVWDTSYYMFAKNVLKQGKSLAPALLLLIALHDKLDELARVDDRIAASFNILNNFDGEVGW